MITYFFEVFQCLIDAVGTDVVARFETLDLSALRNSVLDCSLVFFKHTCPLQQCLLRHKSA